MTRLVKTLLIWLLVMVVPMQGAAAASMAFCGPNHHGAGVAHAETHATGSAHAHHGDVLSLHALDPGQPAAVTAPDDAPAAAQASPAANQKCSACAACCTLGAVLPAVPVVPVTDPAPAVCTATVPTVDPFATDGPDRPPRNVRV